MNNAIMIPGADYTTNKLDTIEILTPIPCEGLDISQSTASMNAVGSTLTLIVTKTPFDTTDAVIWTTSNSSVATVADGIVTQTGVGVVVITATCGQRTASCTVTAIHVVNFDTSANVLTMKNAGIINNSDYMYGTGPAAGTTGFLEWASFVNETGGYKLASQVGSAAAFKTAYPEAFPCYAFAIPSGASKIRFTHPDSAPDKLFLYFILSNTRSSVTSEESAKLSGSSRYTVSNVSGEYCDVVLSEITQADGADSFVPVWYDSQQSDVTGWASGWSMTISA